MARKNLSESKQRNPVKKKTQNPSFHLKYNSSTKYGEDYGDYEFAYDSEEFLRTFNNSLDESLDLDLKSKSLSFEEKKRLEKQKLLHQKIKLGEETKSKTKRNIPLMKSLELDDL